MTKQLSQSRSSVGSIGAVLDFYGTFAIMYLARQLGKMGALHPTRANN